MCVCIASCEFLLTNMCSQFVSFSLLDVFLMLKGFSGGEAVPKGFCHAR